MPLRHPSHISLFTEKTRINLLKDTINFPSLHKHFECKHDFTGWHTYIMTVLSLVLWTQYHKKRAGQFKSSVLQCCLDGNSLLRRWGGHLPLTEYSKHSFRFVTRTLVGKNREMSLTLKLHGHVASLRESLQSSDFTCLCWTTSCCIRVLLHGHKEVESSLPALLMKCCTYVQRGNDPWIHILLSHRNPGTPVSVLSERVKCILMQHPILK